MILAIIIVFLIILTAAGIVACYHYGGNVAAKTESMNVNAMARQYADKAQMAVASIFKSNNGSAAKKADAEAFNAMKSGTTSAGDDIESLVSNDVDNFGNSGVSFGDWVTSQAVDPQVLKNHAEFISNDGLLSTGRTYSPDMHDSYNPVKWSGLRRPQAVPVYQPKQVPDMDYSLFDTKPSFTWRSS